jgi:PD-(D/E)XK nuclease superfamily protein
MAKARTAIRRQARRQISRRARRAHLHEQSRSSRLRRCQALGDCDRYDVIVRLGKLFWRVQIKSAWAKRPTRTHYRLKTTGASNIPYSADEIDIPVAYIFPEDAWYVFPVALVENRKVICITPGSKRSRFSQYREAWNLMRPAEPETITVQAVADDAVACAWGPAPELAPHLGTQ